MAQSIVGSWNALFAACQGLYGPAGAAVVAGDPGVYQNDLIVSLLEMREPRTRPTAGSGRSRDLLAEVDVVFSQFHSGGVEVQQQTIADAHAAADQLEAYFRVDGNEKLSGNCYDAWVSSSDLRPYIVWQDEYLEDGSISSVAVGRACDLTVTVSIRVRI